MSTAVLMSETWKPTVIQLVPFSNNKMRTSTGKDKPYSDQSKSAAQKRSFPVLAVTRTNSGNSLGESRITPNISQIHHNTAASDRDASSILVLSGRKRTSLGKKDNRIQVIEDKNNNTVNNNSEDGDSMMFSVQDFNDQVRGGSVVSSFGCSPCGGPGGDYSRRDSTTSTDTRVSTVGSLSETPTNRHLPKPSVGSARYFLTQQVKGMVKPTPGEVELQRHRDNYVREQAQKKKKYKLNVNQLPRSTTPINDHDPDKLNMKQVIQFLQNQKSSVKSPTSHVQMNKSSEMKMYLDTSRTPRNGTVQRPDNSMYEQQLFEKVVMHDNSYKQARGSAVSRVSSTTVISTRSTPIMAQKSDKLSVGSKPTSTAKSMIERSQRVKRSDKRAKEFKLYRFLAVVPGNETKTSPVVFSAAESPAEKREFSPRRDKLRKEKVIVLPKEEPEPEVKYRSSLKDRDNVDIRGCSENGLSDIDAVTDSRSERLKIPRTANVVHRKAKKHQLKLEREEQNDRTIPDSDLQETKRASANGMIRLPNMNDFPDDQCSENDQDDDSIILRTVFNVNNNYNPFMASRHQPETEKQTHQVSLTVDTYTPNTYTPDPTFRGTTRVQKNNKKHDNSSAFKKLMINIPDERTEQTDVIKLTLRKEKNATRETSYMTDMVGRNGGLGDIYNSLNRCDSGTSDSFDRSIIRISTVSMQQRSGKDQDDSPLTPSNSMAKSCIKVRQKLKAHMHNE